MAVRKASHAGSWYLEEGSKLDQQLSGWLKIARDSNIKHSPAKALIAPHAGYSYSGATAAFAYSQIDPSAVKRVFLLGPSHHVSIDGCAVTEMTAYETPLYNIPIDSKVSAELRNTKSFEVMDRRTDEDEHSLEMHLPYIAKVMESQKGKYSLVPILVGNISANRERQYAEILAPYFQDPANLFIISSDFCHWGKRFDYTFCDPEWGEIHESIEKLDKMGMDIIEQLDPKNFRTYLQQFRNTICGRNPISILLAIIDHLKTRPQPPKMVLKFLRYAQSSACLTKKDSSVSYASASLLFSE